MSAIIVGSVVAAGVGAYASSQAAGQQAGAQNAATAAQQGMFRQQFAAGAPYRAAGQTALGQIQSMQPYFDHQFNASDLKTNLAPNYQWQLGQGLGAMQNAENKSGGLLSGNTLRSLNNYAQNFAGNSYQQAYDNYTNNQTNIFNRLNAIAQMGSGASSAGYSGSPQYSQNIASTIAGAGASTAGGTIGAANAVTGGLNNAASWYALNNMNTPTAAAASSPSMQAAWGN